MRHVARTAVGPRLGTRHPQVVAAWIAVRTGRRRGRALRAHVISTACTCWQATADTAYQHPERNNCSTTQITSSFQHAYLFSKFSQGADYINTTRGSHSRQTRLAACLTLHGCPRESCSRLEAHIHAISHEVTWDALLLLQLEAVLPPPYLITQQVVRLQGAGSEIRHVH
jgi:hypothetical protein